MCIRDSRKPLQNNQKNRNSEGNFPDYLDNHAAPSIGLSGRRIKTSHTQSETRTSQRAATSPSTRTYRPPPASPAPSTAP
eukprot:10430046-Alexandrium_andersonii.AAC.1